MEKVLRNSINKKQNVLQQTKNEKSSTLPRAARAKKAAATAHNINVNNPPIICVSANSSNDNSYIMIISICLTSAANLFERAFSFSHECINTHILTQS